MNLDVNKVDFNKLKKLFDENSGSPTLSQVSLLLLGKYYFYSDRADVGQYSVEVVNDVNEVNFINDICDMCEKLGMGTVHFYG